MHFNKLITVVDSHTEGMPTRVVTGGFGAVAGSTMSEKQRYIQEHMDSLRTLLMCEPRGHQVMNGAILLPPGDERANLGVVFIDVDGYLGMCGHGTIGTCTVAIETGLIPAVEPVTSIILDTAVGLVSAEATVQQGRVKKVKLQNVPSFLYQRDFQVQVPEVGMLTLDIAYGGNFYAILPAAVVDLPLDTEHTQPLIQVGMQIMHALREQCHLRHPLFGEESVIKHVLFTGPADREGATAKNAVVIAPGVLDRSPCGTGTSARMAQLFARHELTLSQDFSHESITGSLFTGCLIEQVRLTPEVIAVIPTIEGSAWITGFQNLVLDPEDPFPAGFTLG
ncbi:MAG: proline racemase family protein [Ktedonobacteraceae bacterium]|nr:proline racemase family protein [Ktedonobacteraceae bacterium]